jgi:hypothetical protein
VNPALAGVALAVVAGAVVSVSAHNQRTAILGLAVVLILSPMIADPIPDPVGLAARLVGAVLAAYLLWVATRDARARTHGSRVGWPTEVFLAVAAAAVGLGSHGSYAPANGPAWAAAAGFAVGALGVLPILTGGDVPRVGIGLVLLLNGALLVMVGIDGSAVPAGQVLIAGLIATLGGAVSSLVAAARASDPAEPVGSP